MRNPDFNNLLKVLDRKTPDRPTLFEFFLNVPLYEKLAGDEVVSKNQDWQWGSICSVTVNAFKNAGYDYLTCYGSDFRFPQEEVAHKATVSLNDSNLIYDRESFNAYDWPEPTSFDYSRLANAEEILPDGMKLIVWGPGGVLENIISLVGYESLCMMLIDNPSLAEDIFNAVGERFVKYYQLCAKYDSVGALISNDDWGFKTQTMLSPSDMRKYIFGWHRKIVEVIHQANKPAILHSCGNLDRVMDNIICDMKYDAKHSYEDNIEPIEAAYDRLSDRIALLGGIDLDFVCRSKPEQIKQRCQDMLDKSAKKGAYALGTGNSVPEYVPDENYFAMISTVFEADREYSI